MSALTSTNASSTAILLSRRARKVAENSEIREWCEGFGLVLTPMTEAELEVDCRTLLSGGCTRVVVVGGDGTLMRVLSELHRQNHGAALPTIAIVPGGTVNLASRHWHGRGRLATLLREALLPDRAAWVQRECLSVTLDSREYLACTVGAGLVSRFFEYYERTGARGSREAALIALKTFFGSFVGADFARRILSPVSATLRIDQTSFGRLELTLLVGSVFRELGLGLKPTYRAGTEPARVHFVASTLPFYRLGPKLLRVLRGAALVNCPRAPEVIDCLASELRLSFDKPEPLVLDGDLMLATQVIVRPGPKLRVLSLGA